MTLKEYQQATMRTLPNLGSVRQNIDHMIYGMFSEYNELIEATDDVNRAEELTDIMWYFSNYCNIVGFELNTSEMFSEIFSGVPPSSATESVTALFVQISKLTDIEKKELAYGKKVDEENRRTLIMRIYWAITNAYMHFNIDMEESMQRNIDKLKARYPMNFTDDYTGWQAFALNRNLEKERAILEGTGSITIDATKDVIGGYKIINGNSSPGVE